MTAKIPSLFEKAVLWWPGEHVASAAAGKAITPAGDVKQILPFRGAGIGVFDGTTDYLSIDDAPDIELGSSNFTIEFWIRPTTLGISQGILTKRTGVPNTSPIIIALEATNKLNVSLSVNGTSYSIDTSFTSTLSLGIMYHVAIVRNGNSYIGYLNGIQDWSATLSGTLYNNDTPWIIGAKYSTGASAFYGHLSEFRISDVARYTGPFSPPRYKHIPDSNTKLLLHFTPTGTTFTDSSPSPKTINRYGDAKCITSPVEDGGVAYSDGTGDRLTIPYHTDFNGFGASDTYTIEFWLYPISFGLSKSYVYLFSISTSTGTYTFRTELLSTGVFEFIPQNSATWYKTASGAITFNAWNHIAIVNNAGTKYVFINGVSYTLTTEAGASISMSYGVSINYGHPTDESYINGYFSEFVISNGIARYNTNFTPSTQPFQPDSYTKLLLHFWNRDAPTTFLDSAGPVDYDEFPILPAGVTVTNAGTFLKTILPNNKSIIKFNGTNNYITLSDVSTWTLGVNNFTFATWVYSYSFSGWQAILYLYNASGYGVFIAIVQTTGEFYCGLSSTGTSWDMMGNNPIALKINTWNHVALIRSGTSISMYINGVSVATVTSSASVLDPTGASIGGRGSDGAYPLNGMLVGVILLSGKAYSQSELIEHMQRTHPITGEGLLPGGYDYWRLS